jgi:heterodisulfide reductase subunit A
MAITAKKTVLVLGGGIAGITAALELTRLGRDVVLADQGPFLGGRAAHFACKALNTCQKCGACLVEQRLGDLMAAPGVTVFTQARLRAARRDNGRWLCTLAQEPRLINPQRCINCSLCLSECPGAEAGAVVVTSQAALHPHYAIQRRHCLHFLDGSCRLCTDLCPTQAIDLAQPEASLEVEAAAVVLATGYQPVDPQARPHYGYGHVPGVITGLELDRLTRQGLEQLLPGDQAKPRRVAFIQCVGSRDREHPYCSRVCCAYTLRLARLLKHRLPQCEVATFYMDMQNVGQEPGKFLAQAQEDIRLIRALPGRVAATPEGRVALGYLDDASGDFMTLECDLVVLAVGMAASPDNPALAEMLGVELTPAGFFQPASPLDEAAAAQPGIFLAGSASGPRSIAQCISQSTAAAARVAQYLDELSPGC